MKNVLVVFLLIFSSYSYTQIQVKAKIVNAETFKLIEFASVLNLKTLEGAISDTLGFFVLQVPNKKSQLMIQSLGYKTDTFTVEEVLSAEVIKLEVNNFEILDVIVYPKSPFDIVRKAVLKIDENYHAETIAQNVFSREELIVNKQLFGIREINFNALAKFKNDENANLISINKARYFSNIDTLRSLGKIVARQLVGFDSTEIKKDVQQFFSMNFLLNDNLGNSKTSLLGKNSLKYYKYNYNGLVKKDDYVAYHITFDQVDNLKKSLYKGHFYIDTASLAFIDIQIYTSPKGIGFQKYVPKTIKLILKLFGFSFYIKGMDYQIHYKQIGQKWILDKAYSKLAAVVSKKGYSFDGFMRILVDVNKFYPKEDFYNRKSKYDKIGSEIEDFKKPTFFNGLHYVPNTKSSKYIKQKEQRSTY